METKTSPGTRTARPSHSQDLYALIDSSLTALERSYHNDVLAPQLGSALRLGADLRDSGDYYSVTCSLDVTFSDGSQPLFVW